MKPAFRFLCGLLAGLAFLAGCASLQKTSAPDREVIELDGARWVIVEGDILVEESKFDEYCRREKETLDMALQPKVRATLTEAAHLPEPAMHYIRVIALEKKNHQVLWPRFSTLSYAVISNSFPSFSAYQQVTNLLAQACREWESTCGADFRHKPEWDGLALNAPLPKDLTFKVTAVKNLGPAYAAAFFPDEPARVMRIGPRYFSGEMPYDPQGVMRHELGHILGFVHEHARLDAPGACRPKGLPIKYGGYPYDSKSVMHYLCGGVGTTNLALTELDTLGARAAYGDPIK